MVFSNTANNWPADSLFMVASMCVLDVLNPLKKIYGDKTNLQERTHACTFFHNAFLCLCQLLSGGSRGSANYKQIFLTEH